MTNEVLQVLSRFIEAETFQSKRKLIEESPELLSDAAYAMMQQIVRDVRAIQPDVVDEIPRFARAQLRNWEIHLNILTACRELGIDAAFASITYQVTAAAARWVDAISWTDKRAMLLNDWLLLTDASETAIERGLLKARADGATTSVYQLEQHLALVRLGRGKGLSELLDFTESNDESLLPAPLRRRLRHAQQCEKRYNETSVLRFLLSAISAARPFSSADVLWSLPPQVAFNAMLLFGRLLRRWFQATAERVAIDASLNVLIAAQGLIAPNPVAKGEYLSELGGAFLMRYRMFHTEQDLTPAVVGYREAIPLRRPGSLEQRIDIDELGHALWFRYHTFGDVEDLDEAARHFEDALEISCDLDDKWRSSALNNLGSVRNQLYRERLDIEDLEKAIALHREAVKCTQKNSAERPAHLANLAIALLTFARATKQVAAATEAEAFIEDALSMEASTSSSYPRFLLTLADAIGMRTDSVDDGMAVLLDVATAFDLTCSDEMLVDHDVVPRIRDEQIGLFRKAAEHPAISPLDRTAALLNLATGLMRRAEFGGAPSDENEATGWFRYLTHNAVSAEMMLVTANRWGAWAFRRERWSEAAEAYRFVLRAFRALFQAQSMRGHKEEHLRKWMGAPVRAAYALARNGEFSEAVLALEEGRALLMTEVLEQEGSELEPLRQSATHRHLVDAFTTATQQIRAIQRPERAGPMKVAEEREAVTGRLHSVISAIREVPGFERFMQPPRMEDVVRAATDAPLVYAAPTGGGGLVTIVRGDGSVTPFFPPELTLDAVIQRSNRYFRAYASRYLSFEAWHAELEDLTRWLWDALIEPIVDALGAGSKLVIIPFAQLGLLPLHAAWRPDVASPTGMRYALDDLVFTYAPNARALYTARERANCCSPSSALIVDDPQPVAATPLANSRFEAEFVKGAFKSHLHLAAADANLASVLKALADHSVLHFSCHGQADYEEPLRSRLLLANDEDLTLRTILEVRVSARLAVLSACESAATGFRLSNEAIGFPTGLIQAGVSGVVGSLWSIPDISTMKLIVRFYEIWLESCGPGSGRGFADALREAQLWLRDATAGEMALAEHWWEVHQMAADPVLKRQAWCASRYYAINQLKKPFVHPHYWAAFTFTGA